MNLLTMKHRHMALEGKVAQQGLILTESHVVALGEGQKWHGGFESECPGYCGRRTR